MVTVGLAKTRSNATLSAMRPFARIRNRIPESIRPEPVLLREALFILLICGSIDLLPGYFLGHFERYLVLVPGLLIILPPTVGLRGNTFGALASRLGSKLHLGTIQPDLKSNRELGSQLLATSVQLMFISCIIPVVGKVVGTLFGITVAPLSDLLFISVVGGILSGLMMFTITLGITFVSFRHGWDPDNVSAPIIASAGDILTIPLMFFAAWITLEAPNSLVLITAYSSLVTIALIGTIVMIRTRANTFGIIKGAMPIAVMAVFISTMSGVLLGAGFDTLLKGTVFLLLVPAFNGQGGSMGSILGSRVTSAAYLGQHKISRRPNTLATRSTVSLWAISIVVFTFLGLCGSLLAIAAGIDLPSWALLGATLILGATMITSITSAIAYYVAYISFRTGLDPDNVVIPVLTALMDVVGSGTLILCLLGVNAVL